MYKASSAFALFNAHYPRNRSISSAGAVEKHTLYVTSWRVLLQEFASESDGSETDVNIENEYYQAKAAKESNPQAAIAGFERVRTHVRGACNHSRRWFSQTQANL